MSKRKRTFKLKRYPSEQIDGLTHVYPPHGAKVSKIVERDRLWFLANPDVHSRVRPYVPGELDGVQLPEGMQLSEITHIKLIRMGNTGQARIPFTEQQARRDLSNDR